MLQYSLDEHVWAARGCILSDSEDTTRPSLAEPGRCGVSAYLLGLSWLTYINEHTLHRTDAFIIITIIIIITIPSVAWLAIHWLDVSRSWTYSAQTWSNIASVSSRQSSVMFLDFFIRPVSNRMLHSNVRSCQSPAAPFCQPPSTRRATLPSQQVRPSGVLYRWSDGLELTSGSPPGPNALLWLFQVTPEDTLVFAVLDTQRQSVMRSINWLLTYLLIYLLKVSTVAEWAY